jgi:hypothetical protein
LDIFLKCSTISFDVLYKYLSLALYLASILDPDFANKAYLYFSKRSLYLYTSKFRYYLFISLYVASSALAFSLSLGSVELAAVHQAL